MQLVLSVFYMHSFTSLIIILLVDTSFHKREFQQFQNVFHESCKICMFDIYKINMKCRKSNNEASMRVCTHPGRKALPRNSFEAP
jgi:hypothetical protein